MQNPIQKFRQSSPVFEKPGICLKNWKLWRPPTTTEFHNFIWNFAHVSYLPICLQNDARDIILFRSWVICKNKKDLVSKHSQKPGLSITQDLSKISKNLKHHFVDIGKQETCIKFQQKFCGSWSSSKFSIFSDK